MTMTHECRSTLLKLLDSVVRRMAYVLLLSYGRGLFSCYSAQNSSDRNLARRMVNVLLKLRNGYIEKRVVRVCFFSSVQALVIYDMMTRDFEAMRTEIGGMEGTQKEGSDSDDKSTYVDEQVTSPRRNGSVVGEGHEDRSGSTGAMNMDERGVESISGQSVGREGLVLSKRKLFLGGFQRLERASRRDWLTMVGAVGLCIEWKLRSHFRDNVLVRILSFHFRADNVQLLSWGKKIVVYGGELDRFPAVFR